MQVWSSAPWSARLVPTATVSVLTEVSRAVLEVMHEVAPVSVESQRVIAEVLHPVGYTVPTTVVTLPRIAAEVLGLAAEYIGRHAVASRITMEAITSFAVAHRGFKVPDVAVDAFSVALAVDLDLSDSGYLGLIDGDSYGYSLSWVGSGPSIITETWRAPAGTVTSTFPAPSGRLIRSFVLPIGTGEVDLTDLGTTRPADKPRAGTLFEILVWSRGISPSERAYTEAYLRCKWIPESCTGGAPLLPIDQDTIEQGLIDSDPDGNPANNPAWDDLLDDLRVDESWLAFVDCAEAEMTEDDETPFRILDGSACYPNCYRAWVPSFPGIGEFRATTAKAAVTLAFNEMKAQGHISVDYCLCPTCGDGDPPSGECGNNFLPGCGCASAPIYRFEVTTPDPDPYTYLTMEEFLDLADNGEIPCLMFDDAAQTIIDSEGYQGDIPDGMTPSEP